MSTEQQKEQVKKAISKSVSNYVGLSIDKMMEPIILKPKDENKLHKQQIQAQKRSQRRLARAQRINSILHFLGRFKIVDYICQKITPIIEKHREQHNIKMAKKFSQEMERQKREAREVFSKMLLEKVRELNAQKEKEAQGDK